ncbi:PhnA domain-containing protein [Sphingobacterium sp. SRCM116780]|uniref:PhnA domain-containing protein n=1 Tax=Sphingobacterium sp. SRCM116780 TaxID=2907623 RepID=UPI001F3A7D13|nr:alkylphosphonate utilization protein [Sphingobacterium sp. SRCM116780]UIR57255.1 PhnA domain-containing protein [Sphingobacterium sp. SRCM116780]
MKLENQLFERAGNKCQLSQATENLVLYTLPPDLQPDVDNTIVISQKCANQLNKTEQLDVEYWKFLPDTMWSEFPAVQVAAWRMLSRLKNEGWASDALDILYLDDETLQWAKQTGDHENDGYVAFHLDSIGQQLFDGDSVVLTKTLDVKGSTIRATLGTVVKNIRLVFDNTEQIEGKIDGQTIVILTKYLRKQN